MNKWQCLIEKYSERYHVPFTKAQAAFCVSILEEATALGADTDAIIRRGNLYGDLYIKGSRSVCYPMFGFRIDTSEFNTSIIKAVVYRNDISHRHLSDDQNVIISDMRKFIEEMRIEEIERRRSLIDDL